MIFFYIFTVSFPSYLRLDLVRGKECPAGLKPPTMAKQLRKSTVKIRKKTQLRILSMIRIIYAIQY